MPASFVFTRRALEDLDSIWTYIARDSVTAANRVKAEILTAVNALARHPGMGSKRSDITHRPVRFWTVSRYPNFVLIYRDDTSPLQVVAVLHGKRDLPFVIAGPDWPQ